MDMTDRITDLEEQVAYLSRTVDDLSEVIARQDRTLDTVTRRLQLLMERAAEQELDAGGTVPLADQKPPHW
jgi:SlyX protein